jgi:hypothetical protein
MDKTRRLLLPVLLLGLLASACAPEVTPTASATPVPATVTPALPTLTATATASPTPQPRLGPVSYGPEQDQFPAGINPITGLRVEDSSLLELPPVLASISNSPSTARPQAGTSFAPWIFEIFIGTGTSRYMGVFYGTLPRRIPNLPGGCPVNETIFTPSATWIGSRAWLDENQDGRRDPWEAGVGGVCVDLLDASGKLLQSTSTSSNGTYGFDVDSGREVRVRFRLPKGYTFTAAGLGNDDEDSDADPATGETLPVVVDQARAAYDAGLFLTVTPTQTAIKADIAPERTYVGPIRSGRLTYNDFHRMFPNSCLVYASAGDGIRQQLEGCEIVYGEHPDQSPNTALVDTTHLLELMQKSKVAGQPVNYSGNLFATTPPAGGLPATSLWTFWHSYTQALWTYDPVLGAWLRQTDDNDGQGVFHADIDRLTGRQLAFENVIIIYADYQIFRHLQYDIDLAPGRGGYAFLFRDGQLFKIRWSTANREWEQTTGYQRPLHFTDASGQLIPLKPGRTWISVMTLTSAVRDLGDGKWQAYFVVPDDPAPGEDQ